MVSFQLTISFDSNHYEYERQGIQALVVNNSLIKSETSILEHLRTSRTELECLRNGYAETA